MMGDLKIIGRGFSKQKLKKLGCGSCIGCFVLAFHLSTVSFLLKPFLRPPPASICLHTDPIITNFSNSRSDVYQIHGDVRIHGTSSAIFIASSNDQNSKKSWRIRPYPQKMNTLKFKRVTNFKLKLHSPHRMPHCRRNLSHIPAIVFSGRGHAENTYHAFADLLFPLFFTSHQFNRSTIFLVTNHYAPLMSKYRAILQKLSKYDVVDIDREKDVLCFSKLIVGLKSPNYPFIHPNESEKFPIRQFGQFLRSAYALDRNSVHTKSPNYPSAKPRLLLVTRENSRRLLNEREIADAATKLGYDVVAAKLTSDVAESARLVNSFDVMVGVHGAGLANLVFLPEMAVVIQINPFGLDVEGAVCFGYAAVSMNLRYLEYRVSLNESSLLGKYDDDVEVYRDPGAIRERDKGKFHFVYLDYQDVEIDLGRFRKTLVTGLELLGNRYIGNVYLV